MQPRDRQRREVNNYARLREDKCLKSMHVSTGTSEQRGRPFGIKEGYQSVSSINRFSTGFRKVLCYREQHEVHRDRRIARPGRRSSGEAHRGNGVDRTGERRRFGSTVGDRERGTGQTRIAPRCCVYRADCLHRSDRLHRSCLQLPLRTVHQLPVLRIGLLRPLLRSLIISTLC